MIKYNLQMPQNVYSGENALENIKTIVKGYKKIAVFTDKGIQSTGLVDKIIDILNETGVENVIFNELTPEPTCDQVQLVID